MNKYINGNGFLTPAGQALLEPLKAELQKVLKETGAKSESEIRTVGAILSKLVGDVVSDQLKVVPPPEVVIPQKFLDMPDDEFKAYLEFTYGEGFKFDRLTAEEKLRLGVSIKNAMKDVAKKLQEEPHWNPRQFRNMRKGYVD